MDVRQKAKDLVELAGDKRTPEKERANAAVAAIALIRKHDLLTIPETSENRVAAILDGISSIIDVDDDTVQAVATIFKAVKRRRRR